VTLSCVPRPGCASRRAALATYRNDSVGQAPECRRACGVAAAHSRRTVRLPLPTYSPVPDSIAFNRAFPIRASGRTADPFVQRSN
jgi:hypothetical protein